MLQGEDSHRDVWGQVQHEVETYLGGQWESLIQVLDTLRAWLVCFFAVKYAMSHRAMEGFSFILVFFIWLLSEFDCPSVSNLIMVLGVHI